MSIAEQLSRHTISERDQRLQLLFGASIVVGVPVIVIALIIRGAIARRLALARWRECARRNAWTCGAGDQLLAGAHGDFAWTFGVEGSDQDDLVLRVTGLSGSAPDDQSLHEAVAVTYRRLAPGEQQRLRLEDLVVASGSGSFRLSFRNRAIAPDDAANFIRFGCAIAQQIGLTRAP